MPAILPPSAGFIDQLTGELLAVVAHDPAALPFCVIPDRPERLTDDNALLWE